MITVVITLSETYACYYSTPLEIWIYICEVFGTAGCSFHHVSSHTCIHVYTDFVNT